MEAKRAIPKKKKEEAEATPKKKETKSKTEKEKKAEKKETPKKKETTKKRKDPPTQSDPPAKRQKTLVVDGVAYSTEKVGKALLSDAHDALLLKWWNEQPDQPNAEELREKVRELLGKPDATVSDSFMWKWKTIHNLKKNKPGGRTPGGTPMKSPLKGLLADDKVDGKKAKKQTPTKTKQQTADGAPLLFPNWFPSEAKPLRLPGALVDYGPKTSPLNFRFVPDSLPTLDSKGEPPKKRQKVSSDPTVYTPLEFDSIQTRNITKKDKSPKYCDLVLNVGGTVTALDWCPTLHADSEFLAVAAHSTRDQTFSVFETHQGKHLIQIWDLGPLKDGREREESPHLSFGIAHDDAFVHVLKWAPQACDMDSRIPNRRLGLLGAATGAGRVLIFSVPYPTTSKKQKRDQPKLISLAPVQVLSPSIPSSIKSFDWSAVHPHLVTVAFTDGSFTIWKLVPPEKKSQQTDEVLISLDSAEPVIQPGGPLMIAEVNDKKTLQEVSWSAGGDGYAFAVLSDIGINLWDLRDLSQPTLSYLATQYNLTAKVISGSCQTHIVTGSMDGFICLLNLARFRMKSWVQYIELNVEAIVDLAYSTAHNLLAFVTSCGKVGVVSILDTKYGVTFIDQVTVGEDQTMQFCSTPPPSLTAATKYQGRPKGKRQTPKKSTPGKKGSKKRKASEEDTEEEDSTMESDDEGSSAPTTPSKKATKVIKTLAPYDVGLHRVVWSPNASSRSWICYGGYSGLVRCQYLPYLSEDSS